MVIFPLNMVIFPLNMVIFPSKMGDFPISKMFSIVFDFLIEGLANQLDQLTHLFGAMDIVPVIVQVGHLSTHETGVMDATSHLSQLSDTKKNLNISTAQPKKNIC